MQGGFVIQWQEQPILLRFGFVRQYPAVFIEHFAKEHY